MKTYFRAQHAGYSFSDMTDFVSADGGDDLEEVGGICACSTVADLLRNTVMGAMSANDEVVVFSARKIAEIYDGYRVEPVAELARFTVAEFKADAKSIAEQYETW